MNESVNLEGGVTAPASKTILPSEHYDENIALRNKIKERRKEKGLTFKGLEKSTNISAAELCKIENGQRQSIPTDTLRKLSPHLGVSLDYLLSLVVSESISDHERFYDFDGMELDLFKIAKNIYFLDTELFLLLSEKKLLEDEIDRKIIKNYLKVVAMKKSLEETNDFSLEKFLTESLQNFRNYCLNFLENMVGFMKNGLQIKEGKKWQSKSK